MAFKHGKDTVVTLDGSDLSAFTNNTDFPRSADTHDVTTYGKDSHVFAGGLKNGTVTIAGIYDDSATGPGDVVEPLLGTSVVFEFKPEGTGAGLPVRTVTVVVSSYQETSPVADMITWSCEMQMSDDVVTTSQI